MKKLLLVLISLFAIGGGNLFAQGLKVPILLSGGKNTSGIIRNDYFIEMGDGQSFIAFEDAEGVAFDENSTMVFNLNAPVKNGDVRVIFTFSDGAKQTEWWCLGIGESADDSSTPYWHDFDNSIYWLKKGLKSVWEEKKDLKITKVEIYHWNATEYSYEIKGGTFCGQPMNFRNNNAKVFESYSATFKPTTAQCNIFQYNPLEVKDYEKIVIKFGAPVPTGWAYVYQGGYPPNIPEGSTELVIPLNGTNIDDFTIFCWNANPEAIDIQEVYFYRSTETFEFDDVSEVVTNKGLLVAKGGLSFDYSTGVLSTDGTAGSLELTFTNPTQLKDLKTFDVKRSGDDAIIDRLRFYDEDDKLINTWNYSKLHNAGLDENAVNAFKNNKPVKKVVWESDGGKDTNLKLTIQKIVWEFNKMTASVLSSFVEETVLNTLPWVSFSGDPGTPDWNIGVSTDTYYGTSDYNGKKYQADLTGYDELRIYRNEAQKIRIWFVKNENELVKYDQDSKDQIQWNEEGKYYSVNLSKVTTYNGKILLRAIKSEGTGKFGTVNNIVVCEEIVQSYALSGSGVEFSSVAAALSDASATVYDATGITGLGVELTPANPNAIFKANAGTLSNTKNVQVGNTIANLEIADGYPLADLTGATATAATYSRTMTKKFGTICLPYAVSSTADVKYYTIGSLDGDVLTLKEETVLDAGTPAIVEKVSGESITATGSGALAAAGAPTDNLELIGTFEEKTVLAADYAGKNIYAIKNNQFVQGLNSITVPAFRAYFTADASAEANLRLGFGDEATAIEKLTGKNGVEVEAVYSVSGASQPALQKGINLVKFSDGSVKKVIVK